MNDALTMAKLVTEQGGFPRDQVRLLCDRRATTVNIRRRLEWLVEGAGPGSVLLFHYSGHGSQVRDRSNDELDDQLDEILCPYDLDWDDPLTDDELAQIVAHVGPEVRLTVVLDCCHSGTGTRNFYKERAKPEAPSRLRYLTPPPDISWRAAKGVDIDASLAERSVNMYSKRTGVRRFGSVLTEQNVVLIAGCSSEQTSADAFIDNDYRGALTYSLWKALEGAKYCLSNRELVKRAGEWLTRNRYEQVPQLESLERLRDLPFLGLSEHEGALQVAVGTELTSETDASSTPPKGVPSRGADLSAHVVFVHGIGDHKPGYSNGWRAAFRPYFGIPETHYHEVVWDDVFDKSRQPGQRMLAPATGPELSLQEKERAADYQMQIRELLAAREEILVTSTDGGALRTRSLGRGVVRDVRERGVFNWLTRFDEYIGDFVKYLASSDVRDRVDEKLQVVLEKLFATRVPVILITHSWGTVVGYHTLRRMQAQGQIALHCTLGSPLWMFPVRRALGLERQRFAARSWLNIDAAGDLIGGKLVGLYDVTSEALNVDAPGRSPHGSYFVPDNARVQRDLIAAYAREALETVTG